MISGREFRELREAKGLTLKEVARVLKVSEQAVNKYELEIVRNIPLDKIELMAQLYGVSPSYIMEWHDPSSSAPHLDADEEKLIALYRDLNSHGKDKLMAYAADLLGNNQYKKCDIDAVAI